MKQNINTEAYRLGVNYARRGWVMSSHLTRPQNIADFEKGWRSVPRTHAATVVKAGNLDHVYIGTEVECNDYAKSYRAKYPAALVDVVSNADIRKKNRNNPDQGLTC